MRRIPSWGIVLGIIAVAAVLGGGIGWWVSRGNEVPSVAKQVVPTEDPHRTEFPTPVTSPTASNGNPTKAVVAAPRAATGTQASDAVSGQWQQALEDVLLSEGEPDQKADRLLRMMPHLSEEAQVDVSQHLVNFVSDEHYDGVASMVTNAATAESVSTVLMTDLLNRNDALKLPLLLAIARNQTHPKHEDAQNLLELYLQDNYGTDWPKWEQSVKNWLAQNTPDATSEPAPEPTPAPQP